MTRHRYTVFIRKDPETAGVFLAEVPAIRGCHTWGRSREEAAARAQEAIECCLEGMAMHGEDAPVEPDHIEVEVYA